MKRIVSFFATIYIFFLLSNTTIIAQNNDPIFLFNYATQAVGKGDLVTAQICYEQVLKQYPTSVATLHNLAYALRWQGKLDAAIEMYQREIALEDREQAYFGLAQAYLLAGDFELGLPAFERGRTDELNKIAHRLTSLENIHGKKILIRAEWGLGDMLQFIRYAQELKKLGATVLVQSPRSLIPLLSRCPYIDEIVPPGQAPMAPADASIALLSLAHLFKTILQVRWVFRCGFCCRMFLTGGGCFIGLIRLGIQQCGCSGNQGPVIGKVFSRWWLRS
jgi:tetratricopeptide (TPR) repeat protein